jgi:hypothetical protein
MKMFILAIENGAGSILPLVVYDDDGAAFRERSHRLENADISEALKLLGAKYVVLPVEYRGTVLTVELAAKRTL